MVVDNFKYPSLMKYFEEISAIPRKSWHEEKIADYLVDFAKQRNLEYYRDDTHNVLINIPASAGMENAPAILLQGHTDMVCEQNEGTGHDFLNEGLELYVENGNLRARGTTLGADNGVAVAVMLALLDGAIDKHPALQCLFTSAEEVGMGGASAFDYSKIYARNMINLDSPDDCEIIAGCAGGVRSMLSLPITREKVKGRVLDINIGGLAGGHSGEDISKGRMNAIKLLAILLDKLMKNKDFEIDFVALQGGSAHNAIPREANATVCITDDDSAESALRAAVDSTFSMLCAGMAEEDKNFFIMVKRSEQKEVNAISREDAKKAILLMRTVSCGPLAYNNDMSEIVEYSRNMGVLTCDENKISVSFFARSAFSERLDLSNLEIEAYADALGGSVEYASRYPGWIYCPTSKLREEYSTAAERVNGKKPHTTVIHAGLECGVISYAVPDMDIISVGPIVRNLHSPDEFMNLESFERFFAVIIELLTSWN